MVPTPRFRAFLNQWHGVAFRRMADDRVSPDRIRAHFDGPVSVTPLTDSVYEVTDPEGSNRRYAKVWRESKRQLLEELSEIDADIGMPKHRLIRNSRWILVMEPAAGQPLSRLLLKLLLPGIWRTHRERLVEAFENLGRTVGRLHAETLSGTTRLDPRERDLSFDFYGAIQGGAVASPVRRILDTDVIEALEQRLDRCSACVPVAINHGDLMLFHVYVAGADVTLIDFDALKRVGVVDDPVRLICALELFVRRLPYARQAQFHRLRTAFEDGYDRAGPDLDVSPETWATLRAVRHCSLLMYYFDVLADDPSVRLRVLRQIDARLLNRAVTDLVT